MSVASEGSNPGDSRPFDILDADEHEGRKRIGEGGRWYIVYDDEELPPKVRVE